MSSDLVAIENRLWATADQLWANTGLKPAEFSTPVLGLLFLRYADSRLAEGDALLAAKGLEEDEREPMGYQAEGILYLPPQSRFASLLALPEGANLGRAIAEAMAGVEQHNPELKGVLPRGYTLLPNATLVELLRPLAPLQLEGDAFGKVYEYFLGNFALKEGQKGGVFYTPTSIVRLIVEIIEPYHGRIFDPACGSGGMFVQSAEFVRRHHKNATRELTVFGTEKASDTVKLGKMNLAIHGLSGDIREANTYYEDPHKAVTSFGGRFDFVMANPPFNVSGVDKDRLKEDPRFPLGLPSTDNANYLWIQLFHSALNDLGRAGFVMANSAGDARGSELAIRRQLIESSDVDAIVSVGSNFFYTVTLPCTLWFFDRNQYCPGKARRGARKCLTGLERSPVSAPHRFQLRLRDSGGSIARSHAMHQGRFVFAQLMDHLPLDTFRASVRRYRGQHYVKRFSCLDQFLCMTFAQLTGRESLRDIELCLRAHQTKLYHLGIRGHVARSTLADANEKRDWRIFADLAQHLIRQAVPMYADTQLAGDFAKAAYALDSTTIERSAYPSSPGPRRRLPAMAASNCTHCSTYDRQFPP